MLSTQSLVCCAAADAALESKQNVLSTACSARSSAFVRLGSFGVDKSKAFTQHIVVEFGFVSLAEVCLLLLLDLDFVGEQPPELCRLWYMWDAEEDAEEQGG